MDISFNWHYKHGPAGSDLYNMNLSSEDRLTRL